MTLKFIAPTCSSIFCAEVFSICGRRCCLAEVLRVQRGKTLYPNLLQLQRKFILKKMQFYPAPPPLTASGQQTRQDYSLQYHQTVTSPRMNWNPAAAMHAPWAYDFAQYHGHGYPVDPNRSPPYHVSSPDGTAAGTPHNIRDILGAQQQASLQSEIAKTPSSYQQSPTSTAASVFSPEHAHSMRSPTGTPSTPFSADASGAQSFYLPAMPRAGVHGESRIA